jgi:hypothetical protein
VTFSPSIDVRQHGAPPTWVDTLSTPGGDPSDMARRANDYRADLVAKRPECFACLNWSHSAPVVSARTRICVTMRNDSNDQ